MSSSRETLAGEVEHVRYMSANKRMTIATVSGRTVKAFAPLHKGDLVELAGRWEVDARWGRQFVASSVAYSLPLDEEGLVSYLAQAPFFRGLGPSKAALLVGRLGAEGFDATVRSLTPEQIAERGRVPLDVATTLRQEWLARSDLNSVAAALAGWGLTHSQTERVLEHYGDKAPAILRADPYALVAVEGFGFATVDSIALKLGTEKRDPRRLRAGLEAVLTELGGEGHTWTERAEVEQLAQELLALDGQPDEVRALVASVVDKAAGRETPGEALRRIRLAARVTMGEAARALGIETVRYSDVEHGRAPLSALGDAAPAVLGRLFLAADLGVSPESIEAVLDAADVASRGKGRVTLWEHPEGCRVGLSRLVRDEAVILQQLRERLAGCPQLVASLAEAPLLPGTVGAGLAAAANDKQREAAAVAMRSGAAILTGVAGTGKTTAVRLMLALYDALSYGPVVLCAPTGKASRRLEEVTQRPSLTCHSLINRLISGDIVPRAVIVDEASMLDSALLAALLRALPMLCRVVLVGDVAQLPPVGAGYPLRDLIARGEVPCVALDEVVRQQGTLQRNALGVLGGKVAPMQEGDKSWLLVRPREEDGPAGTEAAAEMLVRLFASHLDRLPYDQIYELQVLTAQAPGPLGTDALNVRLQALFQERRGVVVPPPTKEHERHFFPGDKVIFTKNDYDLGLMNGDAGVILSVEHDHRGRLSSALVAWGGRYADDPAARLVEVPTAALKHLALAYAITVHKAQGSEYPCALVVAHRAHAHLHRSTGRAWLYTAVTRAQRCALLFGDAWGLRNAAAHESRDRRRTWLSLDGDDWMPLGIAEMGEEESNG